MLVIKTMRQAADLSCRAAFFADIANDFNTKVGQQDKGILELQERISAAASDHTKEGREKRQRDERDLKAMQTARENLNKKGMESAQHMIEMQQSAAELRDFAQFITKKI